MARVTGKNISELGIYYATELQGRGLVALKLIGVSEAPQEGFTVLKITQATAQKIGRHKKPGETLAQAFERLALAGVAG